MEALQGPPSLVGAMSDAAAPSRRSIVTAAVLDLVAVVVFVGIGRSTHADGVTVAGMTSTSWPFLIGAAVGWLVCVGWRRPTRIVPTGLCVWIGAVALGMALRVIAGQGTAVSFIIVATAFLGATIVGWRLIVIAVGRLRPELRLGR